MPLSAGVAHTIITPPIGVELCGYGYYLERRCQGVRDGLRATALVVGDGGERAALIAADLIGVSAGLTAQVRALVQQQTGIPPEHVMIACSHTHAGPATACLRACGEVDSEYVAILPRYLAGAVAAACRQMRPVRARWGEVNLEGISHNRAAEAGPIDPQVGALAVESEDGAPLAVVVNFACHAVALGGENPLVSRDWPGAAADLVSRELSAPPLFVQGACGDIDPAHANETGLQRTGWAVGGAALAALARAGEVELSPVRGMSRQIELPLTSPTRAEVEAALAEAGAPRFQQEWAASWLRQLDDPPQTLRTEAQVLRLGEVGIAAFPAETFVEFGLAVKARSPLAHTLVASCANDLVGYLPDHADFERGGYAAAITPKIWDHFPFHPNAGHLAVRHLTDLLREVAR